MSLFLGLTIDSERTHTDSARGHVLITLAGAEGLITRTFAIRVNESRLEGRESGWQLPSRRAVALRLKSAGVQLIMRRSRA